MPLLGCTQIQSKRDLTLFVGIAQVFLGTSAIDDAGNPLPKLIYVSREKKHGYDHHKKAGAMNSLVNMLFLSFFLILISCSFSLCLLGHYISNFLN